MSRVASHQPSAVSAASASTIGTTTGRDAVGEALDRRLRGLRPRHEGHDPTERALVARALDQDEERALAVHGPADHRVARSARDRHGLAHEQRLRERGAALSRSVRRRAPSRRAARAPGRPARARRPARSRPRPHRAPGCPATRRSAVAGRRATRRDRASPARPCARASRARPRSTKATISADRLEVQVRGVGHRLAPVANPDRGQRPQARAGGRERAERHERVHRGLARARAPRRRREDRRAREQHARAQDGLERAEPGTQRTERAVAERHGRHVDRDERRRERERDGRAPASVARVRHAPTVGLGLASQRVLARLAGRRAVARGLDRRDRPLDRRARSQLEPRRAGRQATRAVATPGADASARSTFDTHDAQVMPVTSSQRVTVSVGGGSAGAGGGGEAAASRRRAVGT